jgi:hypothetical protein
MKRFLRRIFACLVLAIPAALAMGIPIGAPDVGAQNVGLSCNDGTNLDLALDASAVTALNDAVSGINLNPAGDPALNCNLSQPADPSPLGSGNPNIDYAVGGGRATLFGCVVDSTLIPQETNFALNARVDKASNGSAGSGTFNVTIPQSQAAACPDTRGGHFNGKIDCVKVEGSGPGSAQATFMVTQAAGSFSGLEGELRVDVFDSGTPGGAGDLIRIRFPQAPCDFSSYSATRPVDNGNISVHQAP